MLKYRSDFWKAGTLAISVALGSVLSGSGSTMAQGPQPWESPQSQAGTAPGSYARNDAYRPGNSYGGTVSYRQQQARTDDAYRPESPRDTYVPPPPGAAQGYEGDPRYTPEPEYRPAEPYGRDYGAPPPPRREYGEPPPPAYDGNDRRTYSRNEILDTGHHFFGSVSQGLANVVEYAFEKAGHPNGYILGEDAGGAFVAGLRYGEGTLYTKDAGVHKVCWQGPSVGYDFGGEGSKTMVLVYNLRHPYDIYQRFGGVQGSAYFVGGVGIQFQKHGDVVLAPIRSGIGFRLGANIGYLKYTRTPTWNPF
jgi:hypothetical protein